MAGCPKCGSAAWVDGVGCVLCGHQQDQVVRVIAVAPAARPVEGLVPAWGDRSDRPPTPAEAASQRRLEAAWREWDATLAGDGTEEHMAKVYTCPECRQTFGSCQALAGHINHHRHQDRLKAKEAEGLISAPVAKNRPHRAPPANGGEPDPICPLCAQDLPASVGVLAQQFEREGAGEELALRLATIAWAGLRTA